MRINELKKPNEITAFRHLMKNQGSLTGWRDEIDQFMEKYGFKEVGSGAYATVFINDDYPFALKIFMKDSGYVEWLKFCKANQDNPFVPKVRGNLVKIYKTVYAVRMEKLKPIVLSDFSKLIVDNELNNLYYKNVLIKREKIQNNTIDLTGNKYIDSIIEIFKRNSKILDLHSGNMMKRDDGQIVIIDPFSGQIMLESVITEKHYSGPLYHATRLNAATNIFSLGSLKLNINYISDHDKKHNLKGSKFRYYLSTSRSKTGSYRYRRYDTGSFEVNHNVLIVINPSKIVNDNNYYLSSMDYFSTGANKKTGYSEAEERIFSNEKMIRINDLVSEIHILKDMWPNTPHDESKRDYEPQINKQIAEVVKGAQKYNIDVYTYDMKDRNSFITLNKNKAEKLS